MVSPALRTQYEFRQFKTKTTLSKAMTSESQPIIQRNYVKSRQRSFLRYTLYCSASAIPRIRGVASCALIIYKRRFFPQQHETQRQRDWLAIHACGAFFCCACILRPVTRTSLRSVSRLRPRHLCVACRTPVGAKRASRAQKACNFTFMLSLISISQFTCCKWGVGNFKLTVISKNNTCW